MKLFKNLLGKKDDEGPLWDITPESQRPAPKKRVPVDEPTLPMPAKEDNPFLYGELDTIELEVTDASEDDPYQTHSWELDPENDTRRMKTVQIGAATEKKTGSTFNPYDTGSLRRSWKK